MLVDMKPGLAAVMHVPASTRTAIYVPMRAHANEQELVQYLG